MTSSPTRLAIVTALLFGCSSADRPAGLDLPANEPTRPMNAPLPVGSGWGETMVAAPHQPPLSGGTLLIARDGHTAVVADPDGARVLVVDLATEQVLRRVELARGDEPGRAAEDDARRVHVVLRGSGSLLTVALDGGGVTRRAVCAEPRGVAWDPVVSRLHVACASGTLATLDPTSDAPPSQRYLDTDLRDVVVQPARVVVSRFRSGDLIAVDRDGTVRRTPRQTSRFVAWRMVGVDDERVLVLHQREAQTPVVGRGTREVSDAYGRPFADPSARTTDVERGLVGTSVSMISTNFTDRSDLVLDRTNTFAPTTGRPAPRGGTVLQEIAVRDAMLAVDLAAARDMGRVLIALPGNWSFDAQTQIRETVLIDGAATVGDGRRASQWQEQDSQRPLGQVVAAAFDGDGQAVVQTRTPSTLVVGEAFDRRVIALGGDAESDTGQRMFHTNPSGGITCASCHPEGGDDGHVWSIGDIGPRRTPSMRGHVMATAPFHWEGDLPDLRAFTNLVMVRRMGAPMPTEPQLASFASFIDGVRALHAPVADAAAAERGREVFERPLVGCAACHSGETLTNNQTMDVGTGGAFQVPSLRGVRWRAPFLHDGRAATLADRLGPNGGGEQHGHTAALTDAERADLVAYLESL